MNFSSFGACCFAPKQQKLRRSRNFKLKIVYHPQRRRPAGPLRAYFLISVAARRQAPVRARGGYRPRARGPSRSARIARAERSVARAMRAHFFAKQKNNFFFAKQRKNKFFFAKQRKIAKNIFSRSEKIFFVFFAPSAQKRFFNVKTKIFEENLRFYVEKRKFPRLFL